MPNVPAISSKINCFRNVSCKVGLYSLENVPLTNINVTDDFPTPATPNTTTLQSADVEILSLRELDESECLEFIFFYFLY